MQANNSQRQPMSFWQFAWREVKHWKSDKFGKFDNEPQRASREEASCEP